MRYLVRLPSHAPESSPAFFRSLARRPRGRTDLSHRPLAPPPRSAPSLRPLAQAFFPLLDLLLAFAQLFINSRPTNKQLYDVVMVSGILNAYSISEWSTACARVKLIKRAAYSLIRVPIFPALKTPILRERRSSIHANE